MLALARGSAPELEAALKAEVESGAFKTDSQTHLFAWILSRLLTGKPTKHLWTIGAVSVALILMGRIFDGTFAAFHTFAYVCFAIGACLPLIPLAVSNIRTAAKRS